MNEYTEENILPGPSTGIGSIQEPDEKHNNVDVKIVEDYKKFRITIEPSMFLLVLGASLSGFVQTNLFEERMCLHSSLVKNVSVDCYHMTQEEEEIVQPMVADLQVIKNYIETLLPSIMTLFFGPWSDKNGRLPLMISAISGILLSNCMFCVMSTMPDLPPVMFLFCSIPVALSGGTSALYIASFCYLVDITDVKTRAFRLGVLQSFISVGLIFGSISSPYLYKYSSTITFAVATLIIILSLLYTYVFLKETVIINENSNSKLFDINLLKDMFKSVVEQRIGYLRSIIIISAIVLTLNLAILYGEDSLLYMYLQRRFSWTLSNYTFFVAYSTFLGATIPIISLYFLSTKLRIPDMYLATATTGLRVIEKVGLAYASNSWDFYIIRVFGCFMYTNEPLVRSQLSKTFPAKDLGKIFAFIGAIEGFGTLLGTPLYTAVYNMTIHSFSNFIFFLSSYVGTFVLVLYILLVILLSKSEPNTIDRLLIVNESN